MFHHGDVTMFWKLKEIKRKAQYFIMCYNILGTMETKKHSNSLVGSYSNASCNLI